MVEKSENMADLKYLFKRVINMNYKNMFSKINSIHKKTQKRRLSIFNDMRHCAVKYGAGYMDYDLFEMYNLTDDERNTYITRGRNNDLIKKFNNPEFGYIFQDKTIFNEKYQKFVKRDFILVKNAKKEEIINFLEKHPTFMAKPISGTCGKGILKINTKDYQSLDELYNFLIEKEHDFELEEIIIQHEKLNKIYAKAINTVRIVTILDDNSIPHVICAYFRIGNGSFVDNFNSGGMVAPVDEKRGIVLDKAIDKNKNLYDIHPLTKAKIKGFKFPDWDIALKMVKEASTITKEVRYVGWDVAFTPDGPIFVEGNDYPGHDIYQLPEHTPSKIGIWPKFSKALNDIEDKKSK